MLEFESFMQPTKNIFIVAFTQKKGGRLKCKNLSQPLFYYLIFIFSTRAPSL